MTQEAASAWRVVETANRVRTRGALTNGFASAFAVKLDGPPDEGTRNLLNAIDTAAKIANEISRPFPTSDSDFEKYSKLEAGSAKDGRPRVRISAEANTRRS